MSVLNELYNYSERSHVLKTIVVLTIAAACSEQSAMFGSCTTPHSSGDMKCEVLKVLFTTLISQAITPGRRSTTPFKVKCISAVGAGEGVIYSPLLEAQRGC